MDHTIDEFWKRFEEQAGERVVAKAMGAWMEPKYGTKGLWGLLVLCEKSFRFHWVPSENWIEAMFAAPGRRGREKETVDDIVVPYDTVISIDVPKPGLLSRFLGTSLSAIVLEWKGPDGPRREIFSCDRLKEFSTELRERAGAVKA